MCMIVRTEKRTVFRWLNVIFMISLLDFMATNIFLKNMNTICCNEKERARLTVKAPLMQYSPAPFVLHLLQIFTG